MKRETLSLRAQAVAWLAQREHSELELRRKLLRRLQTAARESKDADAATVQGATAEAQAHQIQARGEPGANALGDAEQVDAVIVWLRQRSYLDDDRFVASRVHVRSGRFGLARIQQELSRHSLAVPQEAVQSLRSTELARATAVWQRKFGQVAGDLREAARQARFLAGRGFSAEVVRKVLRTAGSVGSGDQDGA